MTPTIFSHPDSFAGEGRKYYMGLFEDGFFSFFETVSPGRSWGEFENMSALISAADISGVQGTALFRINYFFKQNKSTLKN